MDERRGRFGAMLGAGALVVALGAWLLMREPAAIDSTPRASVLAPASAASGTAKPELPAAPAQGDKPQSLEAPEMQIFASDTSSPPLGNVQVSLVEGDNKPVDVVIDA